MPTYETPTGFYEKSIEDVVNAEVFRIIYERARRIQESTLGGLIRPSYSVAEVSETAPEFTVRRENSFSQLEKEFEAMAATASTMGTPSLAGFMDTLNAAWTALGDDFELGDEDEYRKTDPLSFDELMEFGKGGAE